MTLKLKNLKKVKYEDLYVVFIYRGPQKMRQTFRMTRRTSNGFFKKKLFKSTVCLFTTM